jgi:hypothetical protein
MRVTIEGDRDQIAEAAAIVATPEINPRRMGEAKKRYEQAQAQRRLLREAFYKVRGNNQTLADLLAQALGGKFPVTRALLGVAEKALRGTG